MKNDPYKLWKADLYKCPDCSFEVITGFGAHNYAEHFQDTFAKRFSEAEPKFWDKSCS